MQPHPGALLRSATVSACQDTSVEASSVRTKQSSSGACKQDLPRSAKMKLPNWLGPPRSKLSQNHDEDVWAFWVFQELAYNQSGRSGRLQGQAQGVLKTLLEFTKKTGFVCLNLVNPPCIPGYTASFSFSFMHLLEAEFFVSFCQLPEATST